MALTKILNHFNGRYSIPHDSDTEFNQSGKQNSAWSVNNNILQTIKSHSDVTKVRLVSSLKNFEAAFLSKEIRSNKPYHTLIELKRDDQAYQNIRQLLLCLMDHEEELPETGCIEWDDIEQLKKALAE